MRRVQKELAGNLIRLMEQMHDRIRADIEKWNIQEALALLADCQEKAVELGTMIEEAEGDGFKTVSMLEEYCEELYQIYDGLSKNEELKPNKIYKNLRQQMIRISNSVADDVTVRREVVFLPYKASMWDSLESVWKAADADETCDAYVVPIPYYDRRADGSFGTMHYEGNQYPAYVPITDWREYDPAQRRPDMIFIHNPYDEFNYVTSVAPAYYAKNLKQCTDMLVYIPYFVLEEVSPDNAEAVKSVEHFVTVPGVFHAARVIVQSEDMRKVYINVLAETFGQETRTVWERKILGLGSPKVDKVISAGTEQPEIPEKWRRIIVKPDNSFKRIVFYNTGLGGLLHYNDKMLEKLLEIFAVFRRHQDSVALLWRPHPLIEATIVSMRPELWEKYRIIRDRYIEEGWGIYDDTADLNRAIALSDFCYGDNSSVRHLYHKCGKRYILQQPYLMSGNVRYAIGVVEPILHIDGEFWFVPFYGKTLYRMDCESFTARRVCEFTERDSEALFSGIVRHDDKLFFVPAHADHIWIYHLREESLHRLAFCEQELLRDGIKNTKFTACVVRDGRLYMIPYGYHALLEINLDTEVIEEYPVGRVNGEPVSAANAALAGNGIYFCDAEEMCVIRFDTAQKRLERICPGRGPCAYTHLFYVSGKIWLIPYRVQDGIRIWNPESNEIEETIPLPSQVTAEPDESEIGKFPESIAVRLRSGRIPYFRKGILHEEDIYLIASYLGRNIVVHTHSKKVSVWDVEIDENCFENAKYTYLRDSKLLTCVSKDSKLYAISGISGEWFCCREKIWQPIEKKISFVGSEAPLILDNHWIDGGKEEMLSMAGTVQAGAAVYECLKKEQEQ